MIGPGTTRNLPVVRTLVVVPTYNEAENIATLLQRVRTAAPAADILVVDDASPDGTAAIVEETAARLGGRIEVLGRPGKAGLGAAYRAGFGWGRAHGYDVFVEIDADLSHDPATLPGMLDAVGAGADVVIGSRYVPGGSIPEWAWHRRALSRWGNRYAAGMLRLDVADATAGYRAYRGELLDRIDLLAVRADGYGFQIEMTYRAAEVGGAIVEVPISFTDRTEGSSKMSSRIIVEALLLVTWWGVRDRLVRRRHPIRSRP